MGVVAGRQDVMHMLVKWEWPAVLQVCLCIQEVSLYGRHI